MPVGDVLLGIEDHDVYKESSWGENVPVLIEQRHMSVSCVGAQSGRSQWSEKGEYEELSVQSVNWVLYAPPEKVPVSVHLSSVKTKNYQRVTVRKINK